MVAMEFYVGDVNGPYLIGEGNLFVTQQMRNNHLLKVAF